MTTRERRRVSAGVPGAMDAARVSIMGFDEWWWGSLLGLRRYFPAARTQLSEMNVCGKALARYIRDADAVDLRFCCECHGR